MTDANHGILTSSSYLEMVNNNLINFTLPSKNISSVINASSFHGGDISQNIINGSLSASGISLNNSSSNKLICNNIYTSREGMNIFYNSDNLIIKGNTLSASKDLIIRSVIGPQLQHGNEFIGGNAEGN
ncbi:MAG: hypothetical protein IPO92_20250 [Saprospiraceae bacterium]|nr:hypothetical protein [Saprospiraceae bacterium]